LERPDFIDKIRREFARKHSLSVFVDDGAKPLKAPVAGADKAKIKQWIDLQNQVEKKAKSFAEPFKITSPYLFIYASFVSYLRHSRQNLDAIRHQTEPTFTDEIFYPQVVMIASERSLPRGHFRPYDLILYILQITSAAALVFFSSLILRSSGVMGYISEYVGYIGGFVMGVIFLYWTFTGLTQKDGKPKDLKKIRSLKRYLIWVGHCY
jgi:hypothetical protein